MRSEHEQIIDIINSDEVIKAEWDSYTNDKAEEVVKDFNEYLEG